VAIQLTPDQVPAFWEVIKYGSAESDNIPEKYRQVYLNRLLYLLLSGQAQCFIRLDKERKLQSICITKVTVSEMTGEKALFIKNVYSFAKFPAEYWAEDFASLVDLAKKEGCKTVYGWTTNSQIASLAKLFNMKEMTRSYGIEL
jgi:hypothetical protein